MTDISRRAAFLSTTALVPAVIAAGALAACTAQQLATASADLAAVNKEATALGPFVQATLLMIGGLIPGADTIIAGAQTVISAAEAALPTLQAATTAAAGQTPAGQIATALGTALGLANQAVALAPTTTQAKVQPALTAIQAGVTLLTAFAATGMVPAPAPSAAMVAPFHIFGT